MTPIPDIIKRALTETIVNIGQLSKDDIKLLDLYVKKGYLDKGKGGPFPAIKMVYAHKDYDFAKEREQYIQEMFDLCRQFGEKVIIKYE